MTSWTELEESMAQPVARTLMTSWVSPRMERPWAAMVRAATWGAVPGGRQGAGPAERTGRPSRSAVSFTGGAADC